jgi:hypothetical protein
MSDLFSIYEDELNGVFNKLNTIIRSMNNLSKEKTEKAIGDANDLLQEALSVMKSLEIEASTSGQKDKLLLKIRGFKNDYESIKSQYLNLEKNYIHAKSNEAIYLNSEDDYNNKNLVAHEEMAYNKSNHSKLAKGKDLALEIDSMGNEALRQLQGHTVMMKNTIKNLENENEVLANSNGLLGMMTRRENKNKLIIAVSIFALILIGITIYFTTS